jgi:predicted PurR-regulated permease PerM
LIPVLIEQIKILNYNLPQYKLYVIEKIIPFFYSKFSLQNHDFSVLLKQSLSGSGGKIIKNFGGFVPHILHSSMIIFNFFVYVFFIPLAAFLFMKDWDLIYNKLLNLIPEEGRNIFESKVKEINLIISGYIRGQAFVCFFLIANYTLWLSMIGLNYSFIISIVSGILSFIPYVGFSIGLISSLLISYLQMGDLSLFWKIFIIFGLSAIVENNILLPKLVGDRIGIHPLALLFSILLFSSLLGFTGTIIAVPMTAIIGVILKFVVQRYKKSKYYS